MKGYQVGEIANYFGVSKDTIRWYDKVGILSPQKGENNYRYYSREEFIAMDYIMRLKRLGLPLQEIKEIVNGDDIEYAIDVMEKQADVIKEKILELNALSHMIRNYHSAYRKINEFEGKYTIHNSPGIIYKEVKESMIQTMGEFRDISKEEVPCLTFVIKPDKFVSCSLEEVSDSTIRNQVTTMAITLIDDNPSAEQKLDWSSFEIIQPKKCLYTVLKTITGQDYSEIVKVQEFIKKENYKIVGDIFLRVLSINHVEQGGQTYYECWIPVE